MGSKTIIQRLMKYISLLLCLSIALSVTAQKRVVVIGSSTSEGYGASPDSSYVKRMEAFYGHLGAIKTPITNLAIGGEDCYNGLPTGSAVPSGRSLPDPLNNVTKALSFNPDYVFVNFPTNNYDEFTLTEVMLCLHKIYNGLTANGHTICYMTTTQPRDQFTADGRKRLKVLRDSILLEFGNHAINFWDSVTVASDLSIRPVYSLGDDVHLNDKGHRVLFNIVVARNCIPIPSLPVTFTSFTAENNSGEVVFHWSTASEQNNDRFVIEGSVDQKQWDEVISVKSKWGATGSGDGQQEYSAVIWNINKVVAGMGGIVMILILGGLFSRRKSMIFPILSSMILFITIASCKKESVKKDSTSIHYHFFRIKSVDFDGKEHSYITVKI